MTEKASDLASSREKKKRSYSLEFKKQVVVYVEAIDLLPRILLWNRSV